MQNRDAHRPRYYGIHRPYDPMPYGFLPIFTSIYSTYIVTPNRHLVAELLVAHVEHQPRPFENPPAPPRVSPYADPPQWLKDFNNQFRQDNDNPLSEDNPNAPWSAGRWRSQNRDEQQNLSGNYKRRLDALNAGFCYYYHIRVREPPQVRTLDDERLRSRPTEHLNYRIPLLDHVIMDQRDFPNDQMYKGCYMAGDSIFYRLITDQPGHHYCYVSPNVGPNGPHHAAFRHYKYCFGGQTTRELKYLTEQLTHYQLKGRIFVHTGIVDVCRYNDPQVIYNNLRDACLNLLNHRGITRVFLCTLPVTPQHYNRHGSVGRNPCKKMVNVLNIEIRHKLGIWDPRLVVFDYEYAFCDYDGRKFLPIRAFFAETSGGGDVDLLHLHRNAFPVFNQLMDLYLYHYP
jgi:hypothetical protein